MVALVKFIHISAIAVWVGGLVVLPAIYAQLGATTDRGQHVEAMPRLQEAMKFTYVGVLSPAAFVAVVSGIFLVFQSTVVAPWFGLKLALAAGLVIAHSLAGLAVARQSEDWHPNLTWRLYGATVVSFLLAAAVIALTLWKPLLPASLLPAALSEPGALKGIFHQINPWHRP
ncbi:CopD family protein [Hyphomicrobium sulfonivorans]|uniref:CopD family protein n=1 Tax=Hyphomicrobium sulfonivorans TaxID=121290 RepID=UPI000837FD75|nr:CopD family protein [Hyphomicrobium sulfonivorans]